MYVLYLLHVSNFQPLVVVGRGSETQLQVAENLILYNLTLKGLMSRIFG